MNTPTFNYKRFSLYLLPAIAVCIVIALIMMQVFSRQEIAKMEMEESHALKMQSAVLEERIVAAARNISAIISHISLHIETFDRLPVLDDLAADVVAENETLTEVFSSILYYDLNRGEVSWEYESGSESGFNYGTDTPNKEEWGSHKGFISAAEEDGFRLVVLDHGERRLFSQGPDIYVTSPAIAAGESERGLLLFRLSESFLFNWAELDSHGNIFFVMSDQGIWSRELTVNGEWGFHATNPGEKITSDVVGGQRSGEELKHETDSPDYHVQEAFFTREMGDKLKQHLFLRPAFKSGQKIAKGDLALLLASSDIAEKKAAIVDKLYRANFYYFIFTLIFLSIACFFFAMYHEKKKALSQQLKETKDKMEEIFNHSLPMCITNREYDIVLKNKAYMRAFPAKINIAKTLKDYESRPGPVCHTDNYTINAAILSENEQSAEIMTRADDGTESYYLYTARIMVDGQGQETGGLQSFQDITARIRVEHDLKDAIKKIDLMQGILPLCSYCKKVRDDQGGWKQVELYISDHSNLDFSHGICPDCKEQHFPKPKT